MYSFLNKYITIEIGTYIYVCFYIYTFTCAHVCAFALLRVHIYTYMIYAYFLTDWPTDWLIGYLVNWLIGWLIDWLIDCLRYVQLRVYTYLQICMHLNDSKCAYVYRYTRMWVWNIQVNMFAATPRFARGQSRISFDMLKSLHRV